MSTIPFAAFAVLGLTTLPLSGAVSSMQQATWSREIGAALEVAAAEGRVVMLALGEVGDSRSDAHLEKVYESKVAAPFLSETVNVAAWSFRGEDRDDAPTIGGMEPGDHYGNMEAIQETWVRPNESGVVALPQHVWLSPEGEILLSCPFEIDADELAWCTHEALRRAGIEERPELTAVPKSDPRPPRRLLIGETVRLLDEDTLGRGLKPDELESVLKKLNKRFLTMGDRAEVTRILFTDDDDAVDFMEKQVGLWDMGGGRTGGVVDFVVGLVGFVSPVSHLPLLEGQAGSASETRRRQVAIAYENMGTPDALKSIKKAWKKEKDPETRADWARAMGASGRGDKAVAKVLIRAAEKEKDPRVKVGAILGLGHVAPEKSALAFLLKTAESGTGLRREAAILALGLARAMDARELLVEIEGQEIEDTTKACLTAARAVLDGGALAVLEDEVKRVSQSEGSRARLFFRSVTREAGGFQRDR